MTAHGAAGPATAAAGSAGPALPLRQRTLANGLRVVLWPDDSLPLVAVQISVHAGSADDPAGRSGLAHFVEHLLYQGSARLGRDEYFQRVQRVGGTANGATLYNRTWFGQTVPSRWLEQALWMEAERFDTFLQALDEDKIERQRGVILNERSERFDNTPYGLAFERLLANLYPGEHPYGRPVIGRRAEIERLDIDDMRSFFSRHYRPEAMVLTIVGQLPAQIDRWIDEHFGRLPRSAASDPQPAAAPPPASRAGPETTRLQHLDTSATVPRLYLGFTVPGYGASDDWYAADLLGVMLTNGESSLLHDELVRRRRAAHAVSSHLFATEEIATMVWVLTLDTAAGEVASGAASAMTAVERMLSDGLAEEKAGAALARARRQREIDLRRACQSRAGRADLLSRFSLYAAPAAPPGGDLRHRLAQEHARYRGVELAAVRRLAERHLSPAHRAALLVAPATGGGAAAPPAEVDGG
jgi:zinc protease